MLLFLNYSFLPRRKKDSTLLEKNILSMLVLRRRNVLFFFQIARKTYFLGRRSIDQVWIFK